MTIHEPATLLTDYLLALLGALLAWRLHCHPSISKPAVRWWFRALAILALSAFVGGSYHGFAPNLPPAIDAIWWRIVLWIICLLGLAMGGALVSELAPPDRQTPWKRLITAKFVIASTAVLLFPHFFVAIIDYGLAMLSWAVAAHFVGRSWRGWILLAVTLSGIAAWIQQSGLTWSEHFNHNDLFHLVQAVALFGFFRAARLMNRSTVLSPPLPAARHRRGPALPS